MDVAVCAWEHMMSCLPLKRLGITPHCDTNNSFREVRLGQRINESVEEQQPDLGKRQDVLVETLSQRFQRQIKTVNSEFSPLENRTQRKLNKPPNGSIRANGCAKLSTNVRKLSPNETRSDKQCHDCLPKTLKHEFSAKLPHH